MTQHTYPPHSIAFIGLGAMGYLMAGHLPKTGIPVWVYNRTSSKAHEHAQQHNTTPVSLEQAVQADVIISCLPTSADVADIIQQYPPKAGSIWIDCTSGVPEVAVTLAGQLKAYNVVFLDAPISGQTIGAHNGTLTFMVGGDKSTLDFVTPILATMGTLIEHVGDSGAGFAVKAVNNMLLAINVWSGAEGLAILQSHKVDLTAALSCINASSGRSVATDNILPQRVLTRSFPLTFALSLLAKDTGIAVDLARSSGLATPVINLVQQLVLAAQTSQQQVGDFSTLVQLLERINAIELSNP